MESLDYQKLCNDIKTILRQNAWTYESLGKKIKVPASTLKKQLNAADGSFNKLIRICDGLGIDFRELIQYEKKQPPKAIQFTKDQVNLFSKNWRAFAFFWYLVFERKPLAKIKRRMKIDQKEAQSLLFQLDRVGLIRIETDGRLGIPEIKYVQWKPKDKFSKGLFKEWSMQIVLDGLKDEKKDFYTIQHFQLTPQSRQELHQRLLDLEEEFAKRTLQELRMYPDKVSSIRSILAACEGSYLK